jgi:peptidoglycan-associated lipoprotein
MRRRNWMKWLGMLAMVVLLAACMKPPKKAMADAEQALLDASGVKDCASDKYLAAQGLLAEAEEHIEREEYDEAERKAKAAKKLAEEAKLEGEANWEDCQKEDDKMADRDDNSRDDDSDEHDGADDVDQNLELEVVYFDYDSSSLSAKARKSLDANVRWLEQNQDTRVVLEGHTDERGTPEYNLALGENRARTVRQYLVQFGVSGDRLVILSYGEEKPAAFGTTLSDYAKNRRVEFVPKSQ